MKTSRELAIQCFKDEAEAVLELIPQLGDSFDEAVRLMYECKGKVIVTGVGKSGHIGAKIAATLSSTGTPSFFINPLDVFHGDQTQDRPTSCCVSSLWCFTWRYRSSA